MAIDSYNEDQNKQSQVRHILLPDAYGLVSEVVIAVVALIVLNITWLSNQLLSQNFDTANPLSLLPHIVKSLLSNVDQHYAVQQVLLFGLWAIVGALIYILLFRMWRIGSGVERSVGTGLRYVRQDHQQGFYRWLASLHDFFTKLLVVVLAGCLIIVAVSVCFGIASQELNIGLSASFPKNAVALLLSLLAAIISVRLLAISLCLLSRRFRNWYAAY